MNFEHILKKDELFKEPLFHPFVYDELWDTPTLSFEPSLQEDIPEFIHIKAIIEVDQVSLTPIVSYTLHNHSPLNGYLYKGTGGLAPLSLCKKLRIKAISPPNDYSFHVENSLLCEINFSHCDIETLSLHEKENGTFFANGVLCKREPLWGYGGFYDPKGQIDQIEQVLFGITTVMNRAAPFLYRLSELSQGESEHRYNIMEHLPFKGNLKVFLNQGGAVLKARTMLGKEIFYQSLELTHHQSTHLVIRMKRVEELT